MITMRRFLLLPFSLLFDLLTRARNWLYDRGWKKQVRFDVPVISVGNLTVGGTGKTPMVEYLVRLLSPGKRIAIISRGYGRTTKGFRRCSALDNAATVGDEPFQYYIKFKDIAVAVGEDRENAIRQMLTEIPDLDVILLDDAFQHRRVRPSFSILLTNYQRLFFKDNLMPAGRLREFPKGASRADVVVVTKCPEHITREEMSGITDQIHRFAHREVFFSVIRYQDPVPFYPQSSIRGVVALITGVANAGPFADYVCGKWEVVKQIAFPDHYQYSEKDVKRFQALRSAYPDVSFITTEKDMVKLKDLVGADLPFFYVPIEMHVISDQKKFDHLILARYGASVKV